MKKILKEFKEFAVKGNVIDLATAVIIGGAFGKIVSSLVADIIMPLIGLVLGSGDFSNWKIQLRPESVDVVGNITTPTLFLNSGLFVQHIVDFLIISGSVFLMIKVLIGVKNRFQKEEIVKPDKAEPKISAEAQLLQEIKEILKEQRGK